MTNSKTANITSAAYRYHCIETFVHVIREKYSSDNIKFRATTEYDHTGSKRSVYVEQSMNIYFLWISISYGAVSDLYELCIKDLSNCEPDLLQEVAGHRDNAVSLVLVDLFFACKEIHVLVLDVLASGNDLVEEHRKEENDDSNVGSDE